MSTTHVLWWDFSHPGRLWALLIIPALVIAYLVIMRFARNRGIRYTNTGIVGAVVPRQRQWHRHVCVALTLCSLATITGAWAVPVGDTKVPRERATIVLVLDVSQSMMAADVDPSRFEAEKSSAVSFVSSLPAAYNVSLVTLSGHPNTLVPPTVDRGVLIQAINSLSLQDGTAIADSITDGLAALKQAPAGDDGTYTPVATRVRLPIVIDDLNGSYSATLTGGQDGTALPSRRASVRASNGGGRLISDAVSIDAKDADGHDADTAADAADLTSANGAARLVLTVRNTGEEQLQNVRIDDSVDTGDATVSNLTCAFPDGTTGTVWSGPFEVGGEFTCTADLSGVTAGSEHADTATVTANGVTSGNEVSGLNGYHARVTG